MAVSEMKRLSLVALKSDADILLKKLMWTGSVEINPPSAEGRGAVIKTGCYSAELTEATRNAEALDTAIKSLSSYEKAPKGIFAKKRIHTKEEYDNPEKLIDNCLETAQEAVVCLKALADTKAVINTKNQLRAALEPWTHNYDLPVTATGTDRTDVIMAVMPLRRRSSFEAITEALDRVTDRYELQIVDSNEDYMYLFLLIDRRYTDEALRSASGVGLIRQNFEGAPDKTPLEAVAQLDAETNYLYEETGKHERKLSELALKLDDLKFAYDVTIAEAERAAAKQKLICTESAVIMSGWIPAYIEETVIKELEGFNCAYDITDVSDDEDAPVLLMNGNISKNFESVVEMYSLPKYRTFDPTQIMSVFYFIIFGMMFGDAVYGLILVLAGFVLPRFVELGKSTKQMLNMFGICGISCMLFGILFGSYAGNLLSGIIPPVAFDIIEEPMMFLIMSLVIGGVHLLVGMGIRFYILCKEKKVFDAIVEIGSWYLIFIGIALIATVNMTVGAIVAGVGALLIVLFKARDKKNPVMRILSGLLGLYDIVSLASDLISYSRIMALGLASAVIAMVVNTLAFLPGTDNIIGIVLMIIILIVGHVLNIAINLLGTYVHTSRLQYIEFFGKFFVDGGRKFKPLALDPKYTNLKLI